jgi:hypothetical protein
MELGMEFGQGQSTHWLASHELCVLAPKMAGPFNNFPGNVKLVVVVGGANVATVKLQPKCHESVIQGHV